MKINFKLIIYIYSAIICIFLVYGGSVAINEFSKYYKSLSFTTIHIVESLFSLLVLYLFFIFLRKLWTVNYVVRSVYLSKTIELGVAVTISIAIYIGMYYAYTLEYIDFSGSDILIENNRLKIEEIRKINQSNKQLLAFATKTIDSIENCDNLKKYNDDFAIFEDNGYSFFHRNFNQQKYIICKKQNLKINLKQVVENIIQVQESVTFYYIRIEFIEISTNISFRIQVNTHPIGQVSIQTTDVVTKIIEFYKTLEDKIRTETAINKELDKYLGISEFIYYAIKETLSLSSQNINPKPGQTIEIVNNFKFIIFIILLLIGHLFLPKRKPPDT